MTLVPVELGGLPGLQAPSLLAIGVAHLFTTRLGGVSQGAFASLNLGFSQGDTPHAVLANRARVARALGFALADLRWVAQVHGTALVAAESAAHGAATSAREHPADGLLVTRPGLLASVRGADCLPVLLASGDGRLAAAVHAGWRGLAAGILPTAVERLRQAGARVLVAAIGPGISPRWYSVGPEVATAFAPECQGTDADGRPWVDLAGCAEQQLRAAGVAAVDRCAECTYAAADRFFSYRRDGAVTGRQAGLIACR